MRTFGRWFEDRLGIGAILNWFITRPIPRDVGWLHTLGSATLFLIIVQVVTGIVLSISYVPSPDDAYQSILYIDATPFGAVVRGIHHWGATLLVVFVVLHVIRVFVWASYKYPRELNWVIGAALLFLVLGFAFTGYLLPWDQKAYWATVVGTNVAGQVPLIGGPLLELLRGGTELGAATLVRFYGVHIWILPAALFLLIGLHILAVIRQGIAARPRLTPLTAPVPGESTHAAYEREYAAEKRSGKPFLEALYADVVVSFGVLLLLLVLAIFLGAPLEEPADPNSVGFVPRPEWYFLALFQLLWYFTGPLEPLIITVFFTVAALLFVFVPFLDRNPERHPRRRPIALGLAGIAIVGIVGLTVLGATGTPTGLPSVAARPGLSEPDLRGLTVFNTQGCTACHSVDGVGGDVGGDLSNIGADMNADELRSQIVDPDDPEMPAFDQLTTEQLDDLVHFLEALE
jgi:ubiquinol-cytochrome c reductase cytochrome b subunit